MQITIPVQATTQTIMRSIVTQGSPEGVLIEDLAIASPETLNQYPKGQKKTRVIGAFVFNKATQRGGVTLRLGPAKQSFLSADRG
jgi:hypothetical protein